MREGKPLTRMLELMVIVRHGRVVKRVAVDEELFKLVRLKKRDIGTICFARIL